MPPQALMPLTIVGICWVPVAAVGAVWLAGHGASWMSGHGWVGPPLTLDWGLGLLSNGPGPSWPTSPVALIWVLAAAMALAVVVPTLVIFVKWHGRQSIPGHALSSMATPADVVGLTPRGVAAKAQSLRPSLKGVKAKALAPADTGPPLGVLRPGGPALRASWEDVMLVFMAPRSGKTSEVAVPLILDAPGAVVATSNKSDLWLLTSTARATVTGEREWVFDPQRIAMVPQTWWWNPLRDVTTVEAAQRLTTHFIVEIKGDREHEFWSSAAEDLLASLFLAAGSSGRSLVDVYEWLNRPTNPLPVDLLREHGHVATANGLAGRQAGAVETREGVFETARTAAKCLRDPNIMAWVTPPPFTLEELQTANFAATRQTLYLLTKEAAGGAAPLVAAIADRVMQDATVLAERRGGRLDPPMLVVLDEAANICKIEDLPKLYSHLGSRGIIPVTILQSYPQGAGVWGETGMDTLWAASTVKVVGAGLDDERFLEKVSRLIGDHDVATRAVHQGSGQYGENLSLRRQRILAVEDLRELPKSTAVLFATGCKAALLAMQPWYRGPRAAEITAASEKLMAGLTQRANAGVEASHVDAGNGNGQADSAGIAEEHPEAVASRPGKPVAAAAGVEPEATR